MSSQDQPRPLNAASEGEMATLTTTCEGLAAAVADLKELGADFTEILRDCGDLGCVTCASRRIQTVCLKEVQKVDDEQLAKKAEEAKAEQLEKDITAFFEIPGAPLPKIFGDDDDAADRLGQDVTEWDSCENASQQIDEYIAQLSREENSDFDEFVNMNHPPLFEQGGAFSEESWEMTHVQEQQVGLAEVDAAGFKWAETTGGGEL